MPNMTKREYAVSLGLAKPTRGRMSSAAKEAIAKKEAEGYVFADPSPTPSTAAPVTADAPAAPVPPDPRDSLYIYPSDFRYPEEEYVAVAKVDGKRTVFSVRECCNTCGCSLTNHMCNTPSILGNIVVTLERR